MKSHKVLDKKDYAIAFDKLAPDVAVQVLSTVLYTLDICYGWKGERLRKFLEEFKGVNDIMDDKTRGFDHDDNYSYIKHKYGIDVKKSIEFESKRKKVRE